jgi:HAD superfamily hydrolase (TIGR01490 family)
MKLAIFDFDGTLLQQDTLPSLGREWVRQHRSVARYVLVWALVVPSLLSYKAGRISRETMKGQAFRNFNRMYTGMTRQEIEDFFRRAYPNLKTIFNPAVLVEIRRAQEQGFHSVLLSGSYQELLQVTAEDLGIETVIGAKLAFDGDAYDPRGDTPFIDGQSKCELLRAAFADQAVEWEASRAFGDSYTDIYILETVGEKVAVNPDPQLLAHARQKGWRIISGL